MSINPQIYELSQMMNNNKLFKQDMDLAAGIIRDHFQKKYISKISDSIETHQINTKKNPSKEVTLLNAMKPFLPESSSKQMEKVIEAMTIMDTVKSIQNEYKAASLSLQDTSKSIHEDGVYDIDNSCVANKEKKEKSVYSAPLEKMLMVLMLMSNRLPLS